MYFLLGLNKNLETIALVSKKFLKEDISKASFSILKEAYFSYTQFIQPSIPKINSAESVNFVKKGKLLDQLIKLFLDKNDSTKTAKISGHCFKKIKNKLVYKTKFQLIINFLDYHKTHNTEHYFLIQLLFSHIFLINSDDVRCASSPKALGLLLMDHKEWEIEDIGEMFIHETAHQLTSLDEHRYEYYLDPSILNNPNYYAMSAIRKVKRPLNKVIHSIIVAFEIISYRNSLATLNTAVKIHPISHILKEQIILAINSITQESRIKNILSSRANLILELIEQKVRLY